MNDVTQGERDLKKVDQSMKGTRFLNLSVVSIDIDTLERAFDERYDQGRRDEASYRDNTL